MLKISVQSAVWYDRKNPDASFEFIRSCGFEAVDFNIDHYLPVRTAMASDTLPSSIFDKSTEEVLEEFAPLKAAAEKHGVSFAQMHAPFPSWIPERTDLTDYVLMAIEKCLAVCAYVGCPAIVVHPHRDMDKAVEFEANMAMYRRLIPAARATGVKICLENLPGSFGGRKIDGVCSTPEEVCRYVEQLNAEAGCDAFGFCFDIGHANMTATNICDYVSKLGSCLTVLHLHDNDGNGDWHTAPYTCVSSAGQQTDWEGLLRGLRKIGYRGDLNFETFRVVGKMPPSLHPEMYRFIAATGRYFRERILSEEV